MLRAGLFDAVDACDHRIVHVFVENDQASGDVKAIQKGLQPLFSVTHLLLLERHHNRVGNPGMRRVQREDEHTLEKSSSCVGCMCDARFERLEQQAQ